MIIIQSYIDLITNSSTSVFQFAYNVEGVKDVINAVLKAANSNLTCDDLFDIEVHYDIDLEDTYGYYIDLAEDKIDAYPNKYPKLEKLIEEFEIANSKDKCKIEEEIYEYLVKHCGARTLDDYASKSNDSGEDCLYSSFYVFTAKNQENSENAKIIDRINHLFDYDAMYC